MVPAKLLRIFLQELYPSGDVNGYRAFTAAFQVTPMPHSDAGFWYDGTDVRVGDWIVTSGGGRCLKIHAILQITTTACQATVIDEDDGNALQNPDQSGEAAIPLGEGFLFETHQGLPILYPLPESLPGSIPATFGVELISRAFRNASMGSSTLQEPADGSFADGAVTTWEIGQTTYSTALDDLNRTMKLLLPPQPPALSGKTMTVGLQARDGVPFLLSHDAANPSNTPAVAGSQIGLVESLPFVSSTVADFGPGTYGSLACYVNSSLTGSRPLTPGNDVGQYGMLEILSDTPYPADQPGFWQSLSARITGTVTEGKNDVRLQSASGSVEASFVYEQPIMPIMDGWTVSPTAPNITYSSGVPHLAGGSVLTVTGSVANLATNVYSASDNVTISTTPTVASDISISPGQHGLPNILNTDFAPFIPTVDLTVSGNYHGESAVRVRSRNPHQTSAWLNLTPRLMIMSGTTSRVSELSIPVTVGSGTGPGFRIMAGAGDRPAETYSMVTTNWNPANVPLPHEAIVAGGTLRCDTSSYQDHIPSGPNYSAKPETQYFTFAFRRAAVSLFRIQITGTYSSMSVMLPGLSFPTATNNWLDAGKLAGGSGVPGRLPNGDGCAFGSVASGVSGTTTITFGTETSTNSTNNLIIVRLKLTAGQSITAISIGG